MRIALTVWNGRIAPLFDVAGTLVVAEVSGKEVPERTVLPFPQNSGTMSRAAFLAENGVSVLICGAVSRQVHRMLALSGIEVHPFVSGDAEEVLQAFLSDTLESPVFRMPGCGMGRCRGEGKGAGLKRHRGNRCSRPGGKRGE
ncbi:MAG TPA: NifB/NifX family molybdenum-iron cluster-binding protein [Candidatus Sabulitectum sp.]|nr:NifB/NifX family molybdenum-iron cluster-binding protein [Candidatus Sabulitectum sp.]HPJ28965.1 NifB/NifX family molybdenum-iron cluster-binding protein [Candidatus Sabulitectum sp.]HPR22789.1 NifB/NifX family molybdenum-iron cluster-binding protein [Candidatus Sabulitectum sp.]